MNIEGIARRLTKEMKLNGKVKNVNIYSLSNPKYMNSITKIIEQSRQNQTKARYEIALYESTSAEI